MLNWLVYRKNNNLPEDISTDLVAGFVNADDAYAYTFDLEERKNKDNPEYTYYVKNNSQPPKRN